VKLLEFGIAKLIEPRIGDETAVATRTTTRVLTPEYACPEQVRAETVGFRSRMTRPSHFRWGRPPLLGPFEIRVATAPPRASSSR